MPFRDLWRSRRAPLGFGIGLALLWLILAQGTPSDQRRSSVCFWRNVTGYPCPGGLTRAAALLAKGDLEESFRQHPLGPLLAIETGPFWIYWGLLANFRVRLPKSGHLSTALAIQAFLLVGVWLSRMLLGWPTDSRMNSTGTRPDGGPDGGTSIFHDRNFGFADRRVIGTPSSDLSISRSG